MPFPVGEALVRRFLLYALLLCLLPFEPPHDKTNEMACAPSDDSDQAGHPPSLIRVFAVRMVKAWTLSYPLSAQWRLIRLDGCPGWSESSLGAHANSLVLSWGGSFRILISSSEKERAASGHLFVVLWARKRELLVDFCLSFCDLWARKRELLVGICLWFCERERESC